MSDATRATKKAVDPESVRDFLRTEPEFLRHDEGLLGELGLKIAAGNIIDFGPAALAKAAAAHKREASVRQAIEANARANFSAQAQTHAAVIDMLDARNHSDLARRVDEMSIKRFGLAAGVMALEGPSRVPAGWYALAEGQVDMILADAPIARMGFFAPALPLFGDRMETIRSMALVRMAVWEPRREALIAFGSTDPEGFTPDMGAELVNFLARVVERTAERWPVL
ncbi:MULTISPECIES: DUF484 family protein [unclassified Caulobacter]|jgi:uncharacterized protein YigA (DUF484 family)|uniref:DUF484 family protein n=1 Tax=unclassified Caulobacter TaxID=2648921 RepID=UPI0006F92CE1|nr:MULTISPECIES: DUF484 family protein [unclassified Caulobacter]KQV62571.1 hypothetical protein ASC62_03275 [Caulobacter sp. Root342]KQV65420.1 hypothetical protein ASC70_17025 [Caulobacter sp. Root343]